MPKVSIETTLRRDKNNPNYKSSYSKCPLLNELTLSPSVYDWYHDVSEFNNRLVQQDKLNYEWNGLDMCALHNFNGKNPNGLPLEFNRISS